MVAYLNLLVLNIRRMNWWFKTSIDKENLSLNYEKQNCLKVLPSKFVMKNLIGKLTLSCKELSQKLLKDWLHKQMIWSTV